MSEQIELFGDEVMSRLARTGIVKAKGVNKKPSKGTMINPLQSARINPYNRFFHHKNVIEPARRVNYKTLRRVAEKAWLINTIIRHQTNKIRPFMQPSDDDQIRGYKIMLKDAQRKPSGDEKKIMQYLQNWVLNTGEHDSSREDSLTDFVTKILRDKYTLDQVTTEIQKKVSGKPFAFWAVDPATIYRVTEQGYEGDDSIRFIQEVEMVVAAKYTADNLVFDYENPRTDIDHFGYGYCLPPWTKVLTEYGYKSMQEIMDNPEMKIWDGDDYRDAIRIESDYKDVQRTFFNDGTFIDTSEDHFFKVVDEQGEFGWVKQKDLTEGAWIVSAWNESLSYQNSIDMNTDLSELLGWLYTDGTWAKRSNGYNYWRFYYAKGDKEVVDSHQAILEKYFSNVQRKNTNTELGSEGETLWVTNSKEIDKIIGTHIKKDNIDWLFSANRGVQLSFLRGAFSADGYVTTNYHPAMSRNNHDFIRSISLLLNQIGINSVIYYEKSEDRKGVINGVEYNKPPSAILVVQDVDGFSKMIGFIHERKNEKLRKWKPSNQRVLSETIPCSHARKILLDVDKKDFKNEYGPNAAHTLTKVQNGTETRNKSFSWMRRHGIELSYRLKRVSKKEATGDKVKMFDLSIKNGNSQFVAEGVWVHNSPVEQSIELITSLINTFAYNTGVFSEDRLPRGAILIDGDMDQEDVEMMEDYLIGLMSGSPGSKYRIPIIPSGLGKDKSGGIQWVSFQNSNKEMEFSQWTEFLWTSTAALFDTDLEELGIRTQKSTSMMGENLAPRMEISKSRGLQSNLAFLTSHLNKIINKVDSRFEIVFTGLEKDDVKQKNEARESELRTFKSINQVIKENDGSPVKEEWADLPGFLHQNVFQAWSQAKQAEQMGGMQGGMPGGPEQGGEEEEGDYPEDYRSLMMGGDSFTDESESDENPEDYPEATPLGKSIQIII
jgi:intein/homing endonuclease